ncbi:MAG TPA: hypothetical protein VH088_17370 [Terriglobales bacterium]|nr:hypothetical protein [Terriglobales bacterium]
MANKAQYERGAVKTAKQLGIRALPPATPFEYEVREVLRWNNDSAEMQRDVAVEWRSQEIIDGRRYVLPAESRQGLYFEIHSQVSAA